MGTKYKNYRISSKKSWSRRKRIWIARDIKYINFAISLASILDISWILKSFSDSLSNKPSVEKLLNLAGRTVQGKAGRFGVTAAVRQIKSKTDRTSVCPNRPIIIKIGHGYRGTVLCIAAIPQIGYFLIPREGPG